jgi:6,7-dimethyl-8-ribityllumazine synthase
VVIVAARFNTQITEKLVEGAMDACVRHGVAFEDVDILWVPGAWELPPALMKALQTDRYDCAVALGAVVRGDTPHFDFVAGEASRGLSLLQGEYGVPVGFGLLTCDTMEQAEARAGGAHGNKGWDSALAALEMADLFGRLDDAAGAEE